MGRRSRTRKNTPDPAARIPTWRELTPPRPVRAGEIAAIVLRNAIPILGMLIYGWSAVQFLLLTVFNLGLTIANIGLVGVTVSTLREGEGAAPGRLGVAQWLTLLLTTAFLALLLTLLGGWPILLMSGSGSALLAQPALWLSALTMQLAAIPALRAQIAEKLRSPFSLAQLQARDQPRVGAAFLGIGASLVLSGWAARGGVAGTVFLVIAFTAYALLRELRPDLIHVLLQSRA